MGDVIGIDFGTGEKNGAHTQGEAVCLGCRYTWQAVAPAGTVAFECPQCRTMQGVYRYPVQPSPGEIVSQCGTCSGEMYSVLLVNETPMLLCASCGTRTLLMDCFRKVGGTIS